MAKDLFNRYIWLVDTIYRAKKITFEEINERWLRTDMSEGEDLPLRTFHNHRKAIEQMFDINIECNKRGGYYYYIENAEEMERGGVRSWLLNTFAVSNLINESHHLKQRILFENIPSGREYLTHIIEAMRDSQAIEITYQSFTRDEPHTYEIEPYCVKVFRQRWYMLAYNPSYREIRTYALDRIQSLNTTSRHFSIPKDFNAQDFFYYSFGIINDPNYDVEVIQIKVNAHERKYLRALPMHHTQTEVETTPDYSIMEYTLRPTYDFRQELLSRINDIEVLSPIWLRDAMREDISSMMELYR